MSDATCKFNNVYIRLKDGSCYYDYTLLCNYSFWGDFDSVRDDKHPDDIILVNETLYNEISNGVPSQVNVLSNKLPHNSKIYLAPNCPYGIDDVRRNYTIKRGIDNGDYNVLSPIQSATSWYRGRATALAIFPSLRTVVMINSWIDSYNKQAGPYKIFCDNVIPILPNADFHEMILVKDNNGGIVDSFFLLRKASLYKMLLDGTLKKPCIWYDQLDINSGNDLTLDTLLLVYHTATVASIVENAADNLTIQLNALNQTNWREYPGTITLLVKELHNYGIIYKFQRHASQQSKYIREILTINHPTFDTEKDLKMGQALVNSLLDIGEKRFCSWRQISEKLCTIGLSISTFDALFSNIIRITPKEFKERNGEGDNI